MGRRFVFAAARRRHVASLAIKRRSKETAGPRGSRTPRAAADLQSRFQPMTNDDVVAQARESFGRQAWGEAYALLTTADHAAPLGLADLERLSLAASLIGKDAD